MTDVKFVIILINDLNWFVSIENRLYQFNESAAVLAEENNARHDKMLTAI